MKEYHIGQTVIPYHIEWSPDRSTISLSLDRSMELTVRAPPDASENDISNVLEDRKPWLLETLYGLSEQKDPPFDKEYLSGEKLLYKGRRYRLLVHSGDVPEPTLSFDGHEFELVTPEGQGTSIRSKRQVVMDWYVRQAEDVLPERVERFAGKLGVSDPTTEVRELTRRWGEYRNGTVVLHWRLVLAPIRIQDYVAVHELAHEKHSKHSQAFWNTVGTLVPDYEERREWLRLNGATLEV